MKKDNTRKVWVNPVPRVSAQGRDRQVYEIIGENGTIVKTAQTKKVKEYTVATTYMFPRDHQTNRIYTGLGKTLPNPFQGQDKNHIINQYTVHPDYHSKLDSILENDTISKQVLLEVKHGVEPNAYSSNSKYSIFNLPPTAKIKDVLDEGRGVLDSMVLVLYPRPNLLQSNTPTQELKIAMVDALVDMGIIAPSRDMANPSKHEFYISEDNHEEELESKKRDFIEAAMHRLYMLKQKSTYYKQYQFATVLRTKSNQTLVKGDSTPERVKMVLSDYISDRNKHQMTHVKRLTDLYDLQSTPEGADKFHIMYLVQQAINKDVILNRDNQYIWPSQADSTDFYQLGNTREKVINLFLKEMNLPETKGKKVVTNYYKELLNEVKSKNVLFE